MGTKGKLSTKALSLLLSVVMAASCFSIALPTLAPKALAVSATQWNTLADALYTAYNAGYFATDAQHGYSVTVAADGMSTSVNDQTENGYMYKIVRATADILASLSNDADKTYAHNRLALEQILSEVNTKYRSKSGQDLNAYQQAFIAEIIPKGADAALADTENDTTYWGNPSANATLHVLATEVETNWEEGFVFTIGATRTAEAAVLSDYATAYDVESVVETEYLLTVTATVKTSPEENASLVSVFYTNDNASVSVSGADVDISAVTAYLDYVNEASFAADYAAYQADASSVYDLTNTLINARIDAYAPLRQALNTDVSQNVVETFITQTAINDYDAFLSAMGRARTAISLRPYVNWIKGQNITIDNGDDTVTTYLNKRNYKEDDYLRLAFLKKQAQDFKDILNAQTADVLNMLQLKYGYSADEYTAYINEMSRLIAICQITTVAEAVDYMMNNAAPEKYTAPADSAYGNLHRVTATELQEDATYFTVDNTGTRTVVTRVNEPDVADIETYYTASPVSYLAVGNYSYRSEDYLLAGQDCPVSNADLQAAIDLFSYALQLIANPDYAETTAALFDADAIQTLYDALLEEKEYRAFGESDAVFAENYAWLMSEMISGNALYLGDEKLFTAEYIAAQNGDTEFDPSYISQALAKYNALTTAFDDIKNNTTPAIRDRYQAIINSFNTYIASLYQEVYDRLYNRSFNLWDEVNQHGITSANASIVKSLIAATKYYEVSHKDGDNTVIDGASSDLYEAVNADSAAFTSHSVSVSTMLSTIKSRLNAIVLPAGNGFRERVTAAQSHIYVWNTFTTISSATHDPDHPDDDTKTVFLTRTRMSTDIARVTGENYVVSKAVVKRAIDGLDGFLANENFARLIGVYERNKISSLKDYIHQLLNEYLFSDDMVNTIIALLFPMLTDLLDGLLSDLFDPENSLLNSFVSGESPIVPAQGTADGALDLRLLINSFGGVPGLEISSAVVDVYLDGNHYDPSADPTLTFPEIFERIGLYIYPCSLYKKLKTIAGFDTAHADFMHDLQLAGRDWSYFNNIHPLDQDTGEMREGFQDVDKDGKPVLNKNDFAMYSWGVTDTVYTGANGRNEKFDEFIKVMGYFFSAAISILQTLFTNADFSAPLNRILALSAREGSKVKITDGSTLFDNALGDLANGTYAKITKLLAVGSVTLELTGMRGYDNLWAPVMEGLGIWGTHAEYGTDTYTQDSPLSSTLGSSGDSCTTEELVYGLFYPLLALVNNLAGAPINTLMSILPNVAYNLAYGCVTPLVEGLSTNLTVKLSVEILDKNDIDFEDVKLWGFVRLTELADLLRNPIKNLVNDKVQNIKLVDNKSLLVGDIVNLSDVLPFDITSLNSILLNFLPDLELPAINLARLGQMGTKYLRTDSPRKANFNSNTGYHTVTEDGKQKQVLDLIAAPDYYYVRADTAEVLYAVFNYVFRVVKQNGLVSKIMANFGADGLGGDLDAILAGVDADMSFAALMELLVPNGATYKFGSRVETYGQAYQMATYDWYISADASDKYHLAASSKIYSSVSAANFVYLKENDWTRNKAELFYNDLENTLTETISAFVPSLFTDLGVDSVSEWLSKTINGLFSNSTMTSLVKALVGLGKSLAGQAMITNMVRDQLEMSGHKLGVDVLTWYKTYGYLFDMIPESVPGLARPKTATDEMFTDEINKNATPINDDQLEELQKIKEDATGILLLPDGDGNYNKYLVGEYNAKSGKWKKLMLIPFAPGESYAGYWAASYSNDFWQISFTTAQNDEGETAFNWSVKVTNDSVIQWTGANMYDTLLLTDGADNARAVFIAMTASLIEPLAPVISLLLSADDLGMFFYDYLVWNVQDLTATGYPTPAIQIKGYDCYNGAVIPLLEVLGVEDLLTQEEYKNAYAISGAQGGTQQEAAERAANGLYYLVNKIFQRLDDILTFSTYEINGVTYTKSPLQKIFDLLPKLYYFIQSNGLSTLVDNLLKPVFVIVDTVRPIVDVDLNNLAGYLLSKLLGYTVPDTYTVTALTKFIADKIVKFSPDMASESNPAAVDALMNVQLDHLTVQSLFTIGKGITGIDFAPITYGFEGMCEGETVNGVTYGIMKAGVSYKADGSLLRTSYTGSEGYFTLDYYGADVLTVTLSVVLDLLMFGSNDVAIDEFFNLGTSATGPETTVHGLVEGLKAIFGETSENPTGVPDWDYLLYDANKGYVNPMTGEVLYADPDRDNWEQLRQFVSSDLKQYHSMPALYYLVTDWTYDTAKATDNMLATILDFLTAAVLREQDNLVAPGDKDTITTFSDFVEYLLNNKLASAEMMETIVGLIAKLYNKVPASLVGLVGTTLDVNLNVWIDNGIIVYGEHEVEDENTRYVRTADTSPQEGKKYFTAVHRIFLGSEFEEGETYYVYSDGEYVVTEDTEPQDDTTYFTASYTAFTGTEFAEGRTYYCIVDTKTVVEYYANKDYKWFVETDPDYVCDMDTFVAALQELLHPAAQLVAFLFLESDYRLFKTMGTGSDEDIAAARDQIILNGLNLYERGLVPLFEAIKGDALDEQYKTSAFEIEGGSGKHKYDGEAFIDAMIQMLLDFIDEIKANPVTWLLDRLPGILYYINANGLSVAVENILGSVKTVLDTINTMLDISDQFSISNLAGLDLSDLTMGGVLDLVTRFTGLYFREDLRTYLKTFYMGRLRVFDSITGKPAFTMDLTTLDGETEENRANFITVFITLLVEILMDEGVYQDPNNGYKDKAYSNPEAIDTLIKKDDLVKQIVEALKNPSSIVYENVDWGYFDRTFNLAAADIDPDTQRVLGVPAYTFQYLSYATQWTYSKAATTAAGLESIILGVLKMVDENKYKDITSLGQLDLLNVDVFFTGENLHKLITLLKGFLFEGKLKIGDIAVTEELVDFVGQLLSADLLSWKDFDFTTGPVDGAITDGDHLLPYLNYQDKETADEEIDEAKTYYYDKTTYAEFSGTEFAGGESYYVLNEGSYEITDDTEPQEGKTYYTKSVAYVGETGAVIGEFAEGVTYYERGGGVTYIVNGREDFIKGLSLLVNPAEKLLGWLLFGDHYTFFNGSTSVSQNEVLITLPGSDGYGEGLVLLLEALGCKGLKLASSYFDAEHNRYNTAEFITDLLTSLTDRIDEILSDPINQIVSLIPELIYFINAGGLQTVVANLLAGPLTLVNSLTSILGSDELDITVVDSLINKALKSGLEKMMEGHKTQTVVEEGETKTVYVHDLPTFSMRGINLKYIFELLEAISDIEITDPAGNKLQYFKIGDIYRYTSMGGVGGKAAYKMAFSDEEDFADFITIMLSFVLDVLLWDDDQGDAVNKEAIANLLGKALESNKNKDSIMAIVEAAIQFLSDGFTVDVQDINWLYFDPEKNIYDEKAVYDKFTGEAFAEGVTYYELSGEEYAATADETPAEGKTYYTLSDHTKLVRNSVVIDENTRFTMPERTINYLTYASDWSEDLVNYVYDNRATLIEQVLSMTKLDEKKVLGDVTLGELLNGGAAGALDQLDVFTAENLNKIRDKLIELVGKIPQVVLDLLNIVIDIDFSRYSDQTAIGYIDAFTPSEVEGYVDAVAGTVNPRKGFVNGLCELLSPLDTILDWLFFGENNSLEYFDAVRYDENGNVIPDSYEVLLSIKGSNGYEYGMIPILEMLGVESLPETDENSTISTMLPKIVDALITRVDEILSDPINEVLELIPNLLYFINANGLSVSVSNLLAAPMALINEVAEGGDINKLLKGFGVDLGDVDIMHLDLAAVIGIVESLLSVKAKEATETEPAVEAVKFEIITPAGGENEFLTYEKIKNFFFGAIQLSVSANGKPRGTMVYTSEETPADMLTIIINFAVELILHGDNAKALDIALKLKDGTVEAIVNALDTLATKVLPGDYHWNYFNETSDNEYNTTTGLVDGVYVAPRTPFNNYLTYKSDWTETVANGLYDNLGTTIDAILTLIAGDDDTKAKTLGELINGSFELYSAKNLQAIMELINGKGFDEETTYYELVGNAYAATTDETPQANKTYYVRSYEKFEGAAFEDGVTYFEKTGDDYTATADTELHTDKTYYVEKYEKFVDGLLAKIGSILNIVGLLLNCDLSAWNGLSFKEEDVTNRATFKAGLMEIIKPLYPLLDWLLFGKDYGFFVDAASGNVDPVTGARLQGELLKIAGREGFAYGLMPILDALGVKFTDQLVVGEMSSEENLEGIIDAVFDRVDEILANPVDEALRLLPNLLYFINANGLATAVENLLGSIKTAGNMLVDMGVLKVPQRDDEGNELKDEEDNVLYVEGADIFDFITDQAGIDIMNLDLEGIFRILETKVSALNGLKLNEVFTRDFDNDGVEENILEKFYVGYGASAGHTNVFVRNADNSLTEYVTYKMITENTAERIYRGDILTMLLSVVLEVVLYDGNAVPITGILQKALGPTYTEFPGDAFDAETVYYEKTEDDKYEATEDETPVEGKTYYTKSEFTEENFMVLKALLTEGVQSGEMALINWVYFLNITDADALKAAILAVIENPSSNTLPAQIERTTNYLKYEHTNPGTSLNLWSEDLASALLDDLDGTVAQVLQMVMKDETMTLSKFLAEKLDLFSDEFGAKIVGMITDALAGLDDILSDDVLNTVGALLGAEDLASLKTATFNAGITDDMTSEEKIAAFSAEFARILSPANRVLEWLLFGGTYRFFTHLEDGEPATLVINGGEGYKYGLAPILYALGVDTNITLTYDENGKLDFNKAFTDILIKVFTRVDELLYQNRTAEEVLSLLPELIYFINANGLGASAQNLLAPVDSLLKAAGKAIGRELSLGSLLKIDLDHLDFSFIFKLVQEKTGLVLSDEEGEPIGDYLTKFYFGKLVYGESYGGLVNFKMVYSDTEEKHDMLTILLELVLDVATYEGNAAFIQNLIDPNDPDNAAMIFEMVKAFLYNPNYVKKVKMRPYNWIWTQYDINGGGAEAGKILTPLNVNGSGGTSLLDGAMYGPLYKREMGEYMTRYLTLLINTYITLLGIDNGNGGTYRSLDEIINGLLGNSIYKRSLLEKIADAISGAISGLKDKVGDELFDKVVEILSSSLQVDLNALINASVPEDFEEGDQQSFIHAISEMLSPAAPILRWLLTGQDIALFSNREGFDYVVIRGADGYQNAIVPILEALLGGNPETNTYVLTQEAFEAATNRPDTEGMTAEEALAANRAADTAMLENILNPILNRVNEILADPLTEIFSELPAVIYFVNSQGLDSAFKNLLNPIYEVLTIIEPALKDVNISGKSLYLKDENNEVVFEDGVPQVDLYGLIGIDLATLDLAALVDTLLDKLNNSIDTGDLQLADLIRNNLGDLTMGKVRSFSSKRLVTAGNSKNSPYYSYASEAWTLPSGVSDSDEVHAKDYTMIYAGSEPGSGSGSGDKTDMVTVILKIALSFISEPGNVKVIEGFMKDRVSGDGYTFLCSLLENFSQMAKGEGGQDKIMYTVYYIFYTALTAGVATNNGLAKFNYDYSFLNQLFATSDVGFFRQLEQSLGDLLNKWTGDVITDTEVAPNGLIKFFKAIANFFKKIAAFFRSMFKS